MLIVYENMCIFADVNDYNDNIRRFGDVRSEARK